MAVLGGGGMISLSRAARVPGEGLSSDAWSSGSVCILSALGPGREGAGPGRTAGGGVVPDVPESRLSVLAAWVVGAASLGLLCGCNSDSEDCACTVARPGGAACAALRSPRRTRGAKVGGAVATLISVAPASYAWVPFAAYAGLCGGACGRFGRDAGLRFGFRCARAAPTALISVLPCVGPPMVRTALVWCPSSSLWEEAVEEPDAVAPGVLVCAPSAAKGARSVGWSMGGIGVRSVRGLFLRRSGLAASDICRWCLRAGSSGLFSSSAWKVTRFAAEAGLWLWCRAPADLLAPRGGCGVREESCPAAPSGAC